MAEAIPETHPHADRVTGAGYAVAVLTAMNLLNYVDRYVPSAVKDLFKHDLNLTDAQTSYPLTAFVFVYMIASPLFGTLADRWPRRVIIASGVALWSLATGGAALATGFWSLLAARALVGVGEAAYATLAPPLISDFFSPERRNRVLTLFYVAIPVGSAIGFALGGLFGKLYGWRTGFLVCGLPGVLAALAALRIRDPGRGHGEAGGAAPGWPAAIALLRANPQYVVAVAGYTAVTFAAGGMADWLPTYLVRMRGADVGQAGTLVGAVTVVGGLGGTVVGGLLADRLRGHTKNPYLALAAVSMVPAAVLAMVALHVPTLAGSVVCIGFAQFFLWFYNGPINTVIANAVPAAMRARAFSLSILSIHLLGDAISPPIIGGVSDATGSLQLAVTLVPVAMGVGAGIWAYGWRRLDG
jgi:MFS family permease